MARRQYLRDRKSERRLARAFSDRDRELGGEGDSSLSEQPNKAYACAQCGAEFPNRFALSSHGNRCPQREPKGTGAARGRGGDGEKIIGGPICPLCCQTVPAEVGVLARQLEGEGLSEQALKAAVLCWAGLRVLA